MIAGQSEKVTQHSPLEGEAVLFERIGGTWKKTLATPVAQSLSKNSQPQVARRASWQEKQSAMAALSEWESDDGMYPAGEVKSGHTWKVEGPALRPWLGREFLAVTGSASMTFERVVEFEGEQCAQIRVDLQVAGRMLDESHRDASFELGASGTIHRSLATGIERKSLLTGQMVCDEYLPLGTGERDVRMQVKGPMTIETTSSLVVAAAPPSSTSTRQQIHQIPIQWIKWGFGKHPLLGILILVGLCAIAAWINRLRTGRW